MPEVVDLTETDSESESDKTHEAGPIDAASYAHLHKALKTTPHARLRAILRRVAHSHPMIGRLLYEELVTVQGKDDSEEESSTHDSSDDEGSEGTSAHNAKRRCPIVARWEICANCDEEYDAGEDRVTGECTFHSGELVNWDSFVEWNGPMDPEEERKERLRFTWSCCDEWSLRDGCEEAKHEPGGPSAKRQRY